MQANYSADLRDQIIRNPEAVPLFFHFLRQADAGLQSWGLSAWLFLAAGNMPNLSACDRCGMGSPGCFLTVTAWCVQHIVLFGQATVAFFILSRCFRSQHVTGVIRAFS